MFGTIGHFRPKPGHEAAIQALMDEWKRTRRASIPGLVVEVTGSPVDRPGEFMVVIAMQDEATYRALAASPEQDAWYRRVAEHLAAEPTWEDVAWQTFSIDARGEASAGTG